MLPILSQNTSQTQVSRNCLKGWLGNVHRHLGIPTRFPVVCSPPWQLSCLKQTFPRALCGHCASSQQHGLDPVHPCATSYPIPGSQWGTGASLQSPDTSPTGWQRQREKVRSWPHTVPRGSCLELSSWPATLPLLPCEPWAHFRLPMQVWTAPDKAFPLFCASQKRELAGAPGGVRLQECPCGKGPLQQGKCLAAATLQWNCTERNCFLQHLRSLPRFNL